MTLPVSAVIPPVSSVTHWGDQNEPDLCGGQPLRQFTCSHRQPPALLQLSVSSWPCPLLYKAGIAALRRALWPADMVLGSVLASQRRAATADAFDW